MPYEHWERAQAADRTMVWSLLSAGCLRVHIAVVGAGKRFQNVFESELEKD
ncbi:hypothetical protein RAB80_017839 [Fusarium oxysporum f. sp. vasinfectum]|nr:hypothetical protein RAB80_017839 [Fusarium oxysporum f. sp. vasinfectum]